MSDSTQTRPPGGAAVIALVVVIALTAVWVGIRSPLLVHDLLPFLGPWTHGAAVFAASALLPGLAFLAVKFLGREPGSQPAPRSALAIPPTLRTVLLVLPVGAVGLTTLQADRRQLTLYVDNGEPEALTILAGESTVLGRVEPSSVGVLSVPRTTTTLTARSESGDTADAITLGDLEDILADAYPDMFPDLEHDTGNKFVWNVAKRHCYKQSTKSYGSMPNFGSPDPVFNHKVFYTGAELPFEPAPSSVVVDSRLPMDSREELLKASCED